MRGESWCARLLKRGSPGPTGFCPAAPAKDSVLGGQKGIFERVRAAGDSGKLGVSLRAGRRERLF